MVWGVGEMAVRWVGEVVWRRVGKPTDRHSDALMVWEVGRWLSWERVFSCSQEGTRMKSFRPEIQCFQRKEAYLVKKSSLREGEEGASVSWVGGEGRGVVFAFVGVGCLLVSLWDTTLYSAA